MDEGGLRGEHTPYAGGYDRQPADEMMAIDTARGHADMSEAGPNSDADTLVDDPHASRDAGRGIGGARVGWIVPWDTTCRHGL